MYITDTLNTNISAALQYASLGWRVYPCWGIGADGKCLCKGVDGCHPGKHPYGRAVPHGEKDATTDEAKIREWFRGSAVNVGVSIDACCVLDFDPKSGGMDTLAEWGRQFGAMPLTPTVKSGSGGRHYRFKPIAGGVNGRIAEGVDFLCKGGEIMPPSLHASGSRYEWLTPPDTPLADLPPWLEEKIREAAAPKAVSIAVPFDPMKGKVAAGDTFADLVALPAGSRNEAVNRTIGAMLASGYTPEHVLESGLAWAAKQTPPYSADDLTAKIRDFAAKDMRRRAVVAIDEIATDADDLTRGCRVHSQFAVSQPSCGESNTHPVSPYYGIIGDFVRAVEPHTEADPIGVLACLLTGIGSIFGRNIHHEIGRRHGGNLFILLVGNTTDRKGTCWDVAESILSLAAPDWASNCIENGFGSGEGLVDRIRDAVGEDPGIADKRLTVVEEEWAKPMRLCRSESSILSPMMRAAFDGKPLSVMNRRENRYGCREPHVSVIGMTTAEEMLDLLKGRTELVNGFLNRFLFIGVERKRYLPCGGDYGRIAREHAPRLREAVQRAAALAQPFTIAADAVDYWEQEYRRLEQGRQGNYGKAVARLSVHALKIALVYAALDRVPAISLRHLQAAVALVGIADQTAFRLFASSQPLGDEPAHAKILRLAKARPHGIGKTDAHRLFGNHRRGEDLDADFALLTENGFGAWQGERWYAKESLTGCVLFTADEAACESANLRIRESDNSQFAVSQEDEMTDEEEREYRCATFGRDVVESGERRRL